MEVYFHVFLTLTLGSAFYSSGKSLVIIGYEAK
jgi:hypothetical protein